MKIITAKEETKSVFLLLLVTLVLSCLSCSEQSEPGEKVQQPFTCKYKDWKTYTHQNIKIFYPAGHPLAYNLSDMAAGYVIALERNCRFLNMDGAKDTLVVFFLTGFGQGREMTGREYPFADSEAIHYWIPSFYGPTLMQYLLPKWHNVEPKYRFLKHGLIALFDYSGQDYHQFTLQYLEQGKFIPLNELAVDTTVNSNTERHQTAEAASFISFLTYYYGIQGLDLLYLAQAPFEMAIEGIFAMTVDSMEGLWLDFAKEQVAAMDTTGATE
jgi:hypothetical protein